jgi:hypothetical protein
MIARTHRNGSSGMPRPKTGVTPVRHIRLGDEIWELVERAAHEDETTATAIVKEALAEYMAKRARQRRAQKPQE